jgi:hypothetical protein
MKPESVVLHAGSLAFNGAFLTPRHHFTATLTDIFLVELNPVRRVGRS